jgi:hypothetical protein
MGQWVEVEGQCMATLEGGVLDLVVEVLLVLEGLGTIVLELHTAGTAEGDLSTLWYAEAHVEGLGWSGAAVHLWVL